MGIYGLTCVGVCAFAGVMFFAYGTLPEPVREGLEAPLLRDKSEPLLVPEQPAAGMYSESGSPSFSRSNSLRSPSLMSNVLPSNSFK